MNVKSIALSEVAELNPPAPVLAADEEVSFVPMAAVSELGVMQVTEHARVADLKSGYSYMRTGDVLVAKITPCFENNKIAVASLDRPHGYGSTEFHVIRPHKEKLEARFLVHFLRQDQIRATGERRMTGSAGQRRVPKQFLGELAIPLPPLDEQRRIAAILDQADDLRRKRREALAALDDLSSSIVAIRLQEMTAAKQFLVKLENFAEFLVGFPFQSSDYVDKGQGIALCRGANISPGRINWEDTCYWPHDSVSDFEKYLLRAGDVLLAMDRPWISEGLKVARLSADEPSCLLVQRVARLRPKSPGSSAFLLEVLKSRAFANHCKLTETTIPHISPIDVRDFKIPCPTEAQLREIACQIEMIDKLKAHHRAHLARLDALFASLQHRAFRGDLSAPSFSRAREKAAAP